MSAEVRAGESFGALWCGHCKKLDGNPPSPPLFPIFLLSSSVPTLLANKGHDAWSDRSLQLL